jgi:ABC-type tungstate transport system permease subunit
MRKPVAVLAATALVAAMTAGAVAQVRPQDGSLLIAATTSIEDSGLFDHIIPRFTAKTGITIRMVSRASAVALMTAERGTIDLVMVNDAEALDRFVAAGDGARRMASRLGAYALSDRATWVKSGNRSSNAILVERDPRLFNPYEVVLVSQSRHPHVNVAGAMAFIDWLTSPEGREAIASHRVGGEQLFAPTPGPTN